MFIDGVTLNNFWSTHYEQCYTTYYPSSLLSDLHVFDQLRETYKDVDKGKTPSQRLLNKMFFRGLMSMSPVERRTVIMTALKQINKGLEGPRGPTLFVRLWSLFSRTGSLHIHPSSFKHPDFLCKELQSLELIEFGRQITNSNRSGGLNTPEQPARVPSKTLGQRLILPPIPFSNSTTFCVYAPKRQEGQYGRHKFSVLKHYLPFVEVVGCYADNYDFVCDFYLNFPDLEPDLRSNPALFPRCVWQRFSGLRVKIARVQQLKVIQNFFQLWNLVTNEDKLRFYDQRYIKIIPFHIPDPPLEITYDGPRDIQALLYAFDWDVQALNYTAKYRSIHQKVRKSQKEALMVRVAQLWQAQMLVSELECTTRVNFLTNTHEGVVTTLDRDSAFLRTMMYKFQFDMLFKKYSNFRKRVEFLIHKLENVKYDSQQFDKLSDQSLSLSYDTGSGSNLNCKTRAQTRDAYQWACYLGGLSIPDCSWPKTEFFQTLRDIRSSLVSDAQARHMQGRPQARPGFSVASRGERRPPLSARFVGKVGERLGASNIVSLKKKLVEIQRLYISTERQSKKEAPVRQSSDTGETRGRQACASRFTNKSGGVTDSSVVRVVQNPDSTASAKAKADECKSKSLKRVRTPPRVGSKPPSETRAERIPWTPPPGTPRSSSFGSGSPRPFSLEDKRVRANSGQPSRVSFASAPNSARFSCTSSFER